MSGTQTWKEFLKECDEFIEISHNIEGENWKLVQKDNNEGNSYLICNKKLRVNCLEGQIKNDATEIINIEYNIIYSITYQVPVLYFKGYKADGMAISLEDAWKLFDDPTSSKRNLLQILTQADHPVTFKPYLVLHPCRTTEILSNMPNSRNRIVTFLSTVGPYVKLDLDEKFGLYFSNEIKSL